MLGVFAPFTCGLKKKQKNLASMGWTYCRGRKLTFSLLVWFLFSFSDRLPETRVFVVNVAFFVCFSKNIYIHLSATTLKPPTSEVNTFFWL